MEGLTITIKLLVHGKEVGCIIGKNGETMQKLRKESGALINISLGCPERIVISGRNDSVFEAVAIIIDQIENVIVRVMQMSASKGTPPVTLRLVVPSTQCGFIIGKGGCKLKEIMKEIIWAHIKVDVDMLPNSKERAVNIAGTPEAINMCVHKICVVMLEVHDSSLGSFLVFSDFCNSSYKSY
nr:poly(rC)-binding protein 1-like [Misgurnus anguillicaudatus]